MSDRFVGRQADLYSDRRPCDFTEKVSRKDSGRQLKKYASGGAQALRQRRIIIKFFEVRNKRLHEQLLDHLPVNVGQTEVATSIAVGQLFVVDAKYS